METVTYEGRLGGGFETGSRRQEITDVRSSCETHPNSEQYSVSPDSHEGTERERSEGRRRKRACTLSPATTNQFPNTFENSFSKFFPERIVFTCTRMWRTGDDFTQRYLRFDRFSILSPKDG